MYILEMLCWKGRVHASPKDAVEENEDASRWKTREVQDSSSARPHDQGAFFGINARWLDAQGAWQEDKRGLITFVFLGLMYAWQYMMLYRILIPELGILFSGIDENGFPLSMEGYIFIPLTGMVWVAFNVLFFKFLWRWIRLEIFVQRRIVVRFNRVTRQVHINRPAYAGGVVTLSWDATVPEMSGGDPGSASGDGRLMLAWPSHYSGAGFDDLCMIGGALADRGSAEELWEYIRRYMEEGPDAVPQPARLRSMFPWPWDSVRSTLSFLVPSWRTGDKGLVLTFALILSPLLLLHSICHWLSLLLCWPTRWSGIIKSAGLPGAAVPRLTVAEDFGVEVARKLRASAIKVVDEPNYHAGLRRAKSSIDVDSK